ncbi:Allergen V5/Tpx-1-related protein [Macrophomina phaseolina MS6]|uniref:Allergen V5/Tpx-1-related protein n=1 Tax=Macrophomina phaseolina (strain MS6) TaxID=1126212 RepID=K2QMT3_MACPH|nr:Allergen V5/Tpx-1-related protein [Macrophomina phaseolina MS6]
MRFSAFLVGSMAAVGLAVPVIVTRTAVTVVTVKPHIQVVTNVVAVPIRVVTQVVTVSAPAYSAPAPVYSLPAPFSSTPAPFNSDSPQWSLESSSWTEIGGGTAPGKTSDGYTSTSFPHVAPEFSRPAPTDEPATSPIFQYAPVSKAIETPAPSGSSDGYNGNNGFDPSDSGFHPATMEAECQMHAANHPGYSPYAELCTNSLIAHNRHRQNHSAPAIHWDHDLFNSASIVAQSCNFSHQMDVGGGGYGQNLQLGTNIDDIQAAITNSWYDGEVMNFPADNYGKATPDSMVRDDGRWEKYGHFTQLIWASSAKVGCAAAHCERVACVPGKQGCEDGYYNSSYNGWMIACNYKSTGNVKGLFDQNIRPANPQNDAYSNIMIPQ